MHWILGIAVLTFIAYQIVHGVIDCHKSNIRRRREELLERANEERRKKILAGEVSEVDMSLEECALYWEKQGRDDKLIELMHVEAKETPGEFIIRDRIERIICKALVGKETEKDRISVYMQYPTKLIPPECWERFGMAEEKRGRFVVALYLYKRGRNMAKSNCKANYYRLMNESKRCARHDYENQLREFIKSIEMIGSFDEVKTGEDFERFIARGIEFLGWSCQITTTSGDYGADIIANVSGWIVVLQCKFYKAPVGYHAVQEIYAAKSIYKADYACVVSNSCYSPQAEKGAHNLGVSLIHYSELKVYLDKIAATNRIDGSNQGATVIQIPYSKERNEILKKKLQGRLTRYDIQSMIRQGIIITEEEKKQAYKILHEQEKHYVM